MVNDEIKKLQDKKTELINKIVKILQSKGVDIEAKDIENCADDAGEIMEMLENAGTFRREFNNYKDALEYITENDPSLKKSLELVSEFRYSVDDLDITVFASLLAEDNIREDFRDVYSEIDDIALEIQRTNKKIEELKMTSK